ncbi:hypothetical protein [Pseudoalteromonas sp. NBT06-2]|uniref:hypothetical protein n=1 Tax=Pseudoalteromonas sp. NBT06-2 TaxID=2025950 RepID=UPI00148220BE|nr:hypothetical protein [Pseudoalteromonas sp. NBT06-2]
MFQQPMQLMLFGNTIDKGTLPFILFDYLALADSVADYYSQINTVVSKKISRKH